MKSAIHKEQLARLARAVVSSIETNGEIRIEQCELAVSELLHWLAYLRASEVTGRGDQILDGVHSAVMEAAGTIALGLVRPAIFAMRGQIDLALSWLFFKDHPVEWDYMVRTGHEFKSKSEFLTFIDTYHTKFSERLTVLKKFKSRTLDDPYGVLSAHIHNQNSFVTPKFQSLKAIVYCHERCLEAIKLQSEVSEYIGDIFLAYFGDKWASLPDKITKSATHRVPAEKQPILFS
jgi:hypothetical protein